MLSYNVDYINFLDKKQHKRGKNDANKPMLITIVLHRRVSYNV